MTNTDILSTDQDESDICGLDQWISNQFGYNANKDVNTQYKYLDIYAWQAQ